MTGAHKDNSFELTWFKQTVGISSDLAGIPVTCMGHYNCLKRPICGREIGIGKEAADRMGQLVGIARIPSSCQDAGPDAKRAGLASPSL